MRPQKSYARALLASVGLVVLVALGSLLYSSGPGGSEERLVITMLINVVLVLSLQMFVGNTGVISFGHLTFPALAAYAAALLCTPVAVKASFLPDVPFGLGGVELSPWLALLVGVAVAVLFAALVGAPISRISGLSATIVTLALLVVVHQVLVNWVQLTGGAEGMFGVPEETTFGIALGAVLLATVAARLLKDSRLGLRAQAAREDELAAAAMGLDPAASRLFVWIASAAVGAVGGVLLGYFLGLVSPDNFYFELTLITIAFMILGGMRSVSGAVIGTVAVTIVLELARSLAEGPNLASVDLPEIYGLSQLCLGAILIGTMIWRPSGLFGDREADDLLARWLPARGRPSEPPPPSTPIPADPAIVLRATEIEMRYEGVTAVDGVSLEVPHGETLGVIGPNGAGKTTLLNILSANTRPTSGTVVLRAEGDEREISSATSLIAARAGIARTFQNLRLFEGLPVFDNVEIAVESANRHRPGGSIATTDRLLQDFNLADLAGKRAGDLAQGDRRRLELARAAGLRPLFLLLDEPTAGMNDLEADDLLERIKQVQARLGCGVVVVDHNVAFIMKLCDRIICLESGRGLADGTPAEIRGNPRVMDAYLGEGAPLDTAPGRTT